MPSKRSSFSTRKRSLSQPQPLVSDIQYCQCCDCWKPMLCNGEMEVLVEPASQSKKKLVSRPSERVSERRSAFAAKSGRKQSKKPPTVRQSTTRRQGQVDAKKYKPEAKTFKVRPKRVMNVKKPEVKLEIVPYKNSRKGKLTHKNRNTLARNRKPLKFKSKKDKPSEKRKPFKKRALANSDLYPWSQKQDGGASQESEKPPVLCSQCGNAMTPRSSSISVIVIEKPPDQNSRTSWLSSTDEEEQKDFSMPQPVVSKAKVEPELQQGEGGGVQPDDEAKSDNKDGDVPENDQNSVHSNDLKEPENFEQ